MRGRHRSLPRNWHRVDSRWNVRRACSPLRFSLALGLLVFARVDVKDVRYVIVSPPSLDLTFVVVDF